MSRSGYSDDLGSEWAMIRWRGAVASAFRGRRGQVFLRELRDALDALPQPRLVANELIDPKTGEVCTLGAVGLRRGVDMGVIDPEDCEAIAATFGIADAMAREIMCMNDELHYSSPEERYQKMRRFVERQIKDE